MRGGQLKEQRARTSGTRPGRAAVAFLVALAAVASAFFVTASDGGEKVRVAAGRPAPQGDAGSAQTWRSMIRPHQGSAHSGTATFAAVGQGMTRVEIALSGNTTRSLPAHLHVGACGSLDPRPRFALTSVQGGRSETVLPVDLQELVSGKFSIRVQRAEGTTPVACGEIVGG